MGLATFSCRVRIVFAFIFGIIQSYLSLHPLYLFLLGDPHLDTLLSV